MTMDPETRRKNYEKDFQNNQCSDGFCHGGFHAGRMWQQLDGISIFNGSFYRGSKRRYGICCSIRCDLQDRRHRTTDGMARQLMAMRYATRLSWLQRKSTQMAA